MIELIPIEDVGLRYDILYQLLEERLPSQSISHKEMPTFDQHIKFVDGHPYQAWYFVIDKANLGVVGSVYLTKYREIGLSIFKRFHRMGFGKEALDILMNKHPGKFLANINPENHTSRTFFENHGFKHVQNTYELDNGNSC